MGALLALPLYLGWLKGPGTALLANPFTGGQVWAADVVGDALWAGHWPDPTDQAGFPGMRSARFLAWPVLLAAALLRPLISANAVVHLASWLGPVLGGVALVRLLRALLPDARWGGLVLGGLLFSLSPVTLGAALSGQVENTQLWVLPALLLLTWRAPGAAWSLPLVPLAWAGGALTSPYLALMAALSSPWVAWLRWRRGASPWRVLAAVALCLPGLLAVAGWLDLGGFSPAETVYRPSYSADGWPALDARPLPVAALDTLLIGRTLPQVKALVLHQPYLGLVPLCAAALLGGRRHRFLVPLLIGVLLAMGPRLAWNGQLVTLSGHTLVLPAELVRLLRLPLAHGGQYYRAVVLAHLALAGAVAAGSCWRGRRGLLLGALLVLLGTADSLRSVAVAGLPWPVWELPADGWQALSADAPPGAVLNLPMQSTRLVPCHPVRLAGRLWHDRAVSDLPRAWTEPPDDPLLARTWKATLATPTDRVPPRAELAAAGFALAVVDLPAIPERRSLIARLQTAWGPPDGHQDDLIWWVLAR